MKPLASVSARMKRVRRRDTSAEKKVRSALHRRGLRFRVDRAVVPGSRFRVDIAFMNARVAVFVDGCFWHGCPDHGTSSKTNHDWWKDKINRNAERDVRAAEVLRSAGWLVIRCWEHENDDLVARRVAKAVARRSGMVRDPTAP